TERRRHRRSHDECVSLRHVPAHSRGSPPGRRQNECCRQRQQSLRSSAVIGSKSTSSNVSRRRFLISSAATGGGLALGLRLPDVPHALAQEARGAEGNEVGAWVFIRPNDEVVIRIARSEMGQGTLTGLAQLVAEELECDWKK